MLTHLVSHETVLRLAVFILLAGVAEEFLTPVVVAGADALHQLWMQTLLNEVSMGAPLKLFLYLQSLKLKIKRHVS